MLLYVYVAGQIGGDSELQMMLLPYLQVKIFDFKT